jgi:hypothetical protein
MGEEVISVCKVMAKRMMTNCCHPFYKTCVSRVVSELNRSGV